MEQSGVKPVSIWDARIPDCDCIHYTIMPVPKITSNEGTEGGKKLKPHAQPWKAITECQNSTKYNPALLVEVEKGHVFLFILTNTNSVSFLFLNGVLCYCFDGHSQTAQMHILFLTVLRKLEPNSSLLLFPYSNIHSILPTPHIQKPPTATLYVWPVTLLILSKPEAIHNTILFAFYIFLKERTCHLHVVWDWQVSFFHPNWTLQLS